MPLYEYQCRKCEQNFELLVRMDQAPGQCPHCGSTRLERQLSTFAPQSAEGAGNRMARPAGGCGGPACQMGLCKQ